MWWDALGNYVASLGYRTGDPAYEKWWATSARRTHLVGKGVVRFHAVYWPAMLLSAGLPLPTDILVHDYLTIDGRKISKSGGATVDPVALTAAYGTDAVRWWLLREVPRVGDADFTPDRLIARADADFAGRLGNLVHRIVTMVHRYRSGSVPTLGTDRFAVATLLDVCGKAPARIDAALNDSDFRRATGAAWGIVEEANRCIDATRPWELARAERQGNADAAERLDAVLASLVTACRVLAEELRPFIPDAAARIAQQVTSVDGSLPASTPLFRRLQQEQHA
ncbi:class I tRNA ligase family protein [Streptomyces sp. CG1]|uniref:class I tRNA ligase family protein n=1 Tax=Streptomyces sp. CG1 TaxID=1287523 RepID=UPI0034E2C826